MDVLGLERAAAISDAAGAPATWAEYLGKSQEDLLGIGVYGGPGLLEAVIKDPLGIGYNNLNYAYDQQTGNPVAVAQVVPLDVNNNGRVDENEQCGTKKQAVRSVAEGIYPSPPVRDLNLVTNGQPSDLVLIFLGWILTEGQQYINQAGYVALPSEQIEAEMQKLEPSS
jgi:phosphate transport system substrate-binding protein